MLLVLWERVKGIKHKNQLIKFVPRMNCDSSHLSANTDGAVRSHVEEVSGVCRSRRQGSNHLRIMASSTTDTVVDSVCSTAREGTDCDMASGWDLWKWNSTGTTEAEMLISHWRRWLVV